MELSKQQQKGISDYELERNQRIQENRKRMTAAVRFRVSRTNLTCHMRLSQDMNTQYFRRPYVNEANRPDTHRWSSVCTPL
eukprot:8865004-Pyramimonas_sp.AAC.2